MTQYFGIAMKTENNHDVYCALNALVTILQKRFHFAWDVPNPFSDEYPSKMSGKKCRRVKEWRDNLFDQLDKNSSQNNITYGSYPGFCDHMVIAAILDPTFFVELHFNQDILRHSLQRLKELYQSLEIQDGSVQYYHEPDGIFAPSGSNWDSAWNNYVIAMAEFRQANPNLYELNLLNNGEELAGMMCSFWEDY